MGYPRASRLISLALLIMMAACDQENSPRQPALRVAVPPALAPTLGSFREHGQSPVDFVEMHPYARARDLEVLLFASGSLAFQGVVVPGRYLPLLHPWLTALSVALPQEVRQDVADCLGASSPLALPLTVDFGVLVIRRDLWASLSLPLPSNLASLREACLTLRSREPATRSAIVTDLPVDELFWDLAWSFEGRADTELYTFPKVHVLEFMREFRLERTLSQEQDAMDELQTGHSPALFTSLQKGLQLCSKDSRLAVLPLPSGSGQALALYNGWCLVKLSGNRDVERGMARFVMTPFQRHLVDTGWLPALRSLPTPAAARTAWEKTELHAAPDLGGAGDEIVLGALLDATQGPMTPEEALRRGAARLHAQGGPP